MTRRSFTKRKSEPRRRFEGPLHGRIARLRKEIGISQEELADRLGVDGTLVSHWETGFARPSIGLLAPLARELATTVDDLIEGEERAA